MAITSIVKWIKPFYDGYVSDGLEKSKCLMKSVAHYEDVHGVKIDSDTFCNVYKMIQ